MSRHQDPRRCRRPRPRRDRLRAAANEPLSAANNPSVYSVHQPVVERTDLRARPRIERRQRLSAGRAGSGSPPGSTRSAPRYGDRIYDRRAGAAIRTSPPATTSPGSRPITACRSATARRSPNGEVPPGTVRVVASRATRERRRAARTGAIPASNSPVRDRLQLRLRDQLQPRRDDRQSGRSGPRPGGLRPRAAPTSPATAIGTYRERAPTGPQPLPANPRTTRR